MGDAFCRQVFDHSESGDKRNLRFPIPSAGIMPGLADQSDKNNST
jgi:hypothetical protein